MSGMIEQALAYWVAGGPLLLVLAVVCLCIWFLFLRTRYVLTSVLEEHPDLEKGLFEELATGCPARCASGLLDRPGVMPRFLAGALKEVAAGRPAGEAFDARLELPLKRLSRDFMLVGALTAAAPLIGLLGTVWGMIETFDAVSVASGQTSVRVASGISQALITTQFGLVIAIPGVFGLARLRRLLRQVEMRFALCKTHVLAGLARKTGVAV
jgi:biopolymer transport protein ExbB